MLVYSSHYFALYIFLYELTNLITTSFPVSVERNLVTNKNTTQHHVSLLNSSPLRRKSVGNEVLCKALAQRKEGVLGVRFDLCLSLLSYYLPLFIFKLGYKPVLRSTEPSLFATSAIAVSNTMTSFWSFTILFFKLWNVWVFLSSELVYLMMLDFLRGSKKNM